jgi:hypothetical protein
MKRPMPSPTGGNATKLYLPAGFPPIRDLAAYDEAPKGQRPPPGWLARATAWMLKRGFNAEDICEFVAQLDSGEIAEGEDEHGSSHQHNMMELAAGGHLQWENGGPVIKDRLPSGGRNGLPKNDVQVHDAAIKHAPGLARIKIGPVGY